MEGRASEVARRRVTSAHHPARRIVLGMAAGAVVTVLVIGGLDLLVPLPPTAGLGTVVAPDRAVAPVALGWRLWVVAARGLGTFLGGAVAAWIVGRARAVWPMAVLAVASLAGGVAGFAHPSWLLLAGIVVPWPCAAAARRFARHR